MEILTGEVAFFAINFLTIFFNLMFYGIFAWVICSWLVIFGLVSPGGKFFGFLTQMVQPILAPFRWARLGPVDLSPIVAILVLDFVVRLLTDVLEKNFLA